VVVLSRPVATYSQPTSVSDTYVGNAVRIDDDGCSIGLVFGNRQHDTAIVIGITSDRGVGAKAIGAHLETTSLILLLVSANLFDVHKPLGQAFGFPIRHYEGYPLGTLGSFRRRTYRS